MIVSGCDDFYAFGKERHGAADDHSLFTKRELKQMTFNRNQVTVPLAYRDPEPLSERYFREKSAKEELQDGLKQIELDKKNIALYKNEMGKSVARLTSDSIKTLSQLKEEEFNKGQVEPTSYGIKVPPPKILTKEQIIKGSRASIKSKLEDMLRGEVSIDSYIDICNTMIKLTKSPAEKLWWQTALTKLQRYKARKLILDRRGQSTLSAQIDADIEQVKTEIEDRMLSNQTFNLVLAAPPALPGGPALPGAPPPGPAPPAAPAPDPAPGPGAPPPGPGAPPPGVAPEDESQSQFDSDIEEKEEKYQEEPTLPDPKREPPSLEDELEAIGLPDVSLSLLEDAEENIRMAEEAKQATEGLYSQLSEEEREFEDHLAEFKDIFGSVSSVSIESGLGVLDLPPRVDLPLTISLDPSRLSDYLAGDVELADIRRMFEEQEEKSERTKERSLRSDGSEVSKEAK